MTFDRKTNMCLRIGNFLVLSMDSMIVTKFIWKYLLDFKVKIGYRMNDGSQNLSTIYFLSAQKWLLN